MSTIGGSAYRLGHSQRELERLRDQAELMEDATRRLLAEAGIAPGMHVLDVGSGVGDVSMIAASLVGREGSVVGVDLDRRSVECAGKRAADAGLGQNVRFLQGDLNEMSFEDPFDAAIGRFILMHMKDRVATLERVAGHVRPGGIVAFQESQLDFPPLSEPEPISLWQRWLELVVTASRMGGVETGMGLKMHQAFIDASLPAPKLRMEVPLFTPADSLSPKVAAEALRSLLPAIEKLGIATSEDIEIDTFAQRLHEEIKRKGAVCTSFALVSAWTRKPSAGRTKEGD